MTTLNTRDAHIVTMRELSQNTAKVIERINESREPALVTKHGQFVAMITPLLGAKVESLALEEIAREVSGRADEDAVTSDELRAKYPKKG